MRRADHVRIFRRKLHVEFGRNLVLAMGGTIGDIDDVSRPLRAIARQNDDAAAEQLFAAWHGLGRKVEALAVKDEERGRRLSATLLHGAASGAWNRLGVGGSP